MGSKNRPENANTSGVRFVFSGRFFDPVADRLRRSVVRLTAHELLCASVSLWLSKTA